METVSLIVPVYCEEQIIEESHRRMKFVMDSLAQHDYEIIYVDDGSTDNTLSILKNFAGSNSKVKIIRLSRNFGHQIAITAGLDKAIGDAVIIIDADLQDPPELIPKLIEKWKEGYDVVYAKRVARKGEGKIKRWTASVFYRVLNKLTDVKIPIDTGDFRLVDKKVVQEMKKIKECNRYVRGLTSWVGFEQTGIEYERDQRIAGESKYPFRKMIKFGLDGIFSFSHKPLKISLNVGVLSIAIGMVMILYVFFGKIFFPATIVPGWASILIAVVFFGGVQLFTIGIIGEYIARIYDEAKKRPLYIVKEEINF